MRRFLVAFIFCLLFFSKFISCVFSTSYLQKRDSLHLKSTLNLCLRSEPLTLDPRKNSDGITAQFLMFLYEGLTEIGGDKTLKLALASAIDADEGFREYTIHLKQVYWSNGHRITAEDFKRSWLEILKPSFGAYNPDYFFNIKNAQAIYQNKKKEEDFGVEIINSTSFKVVLEKPDPYFSELLSNKLFFPVHPSINQKLVIKSSCVFPGSFYIKTWKHQDKIELTPNLFHRKQEASRLDHIDFCILEEEHLQFDLFEKGKLDWIGAPFSVLSLDAMSYIHKHPCLKVYSTPSLYHVTLNTTQYPLTHPKIRKALALCLERKSLIKDVIGGNERPAFSLIPPQMHALHQNYFNDRDILLAKRLLEEGLSELNLTIETFPKITLKYPALQFSHVIAQALQQQWLNNLGLRIALQSMPWHGFLADLNAKNYQMAALGKGTHVLDPYYFLQHYKTSQQPMNRCGYENPAFSALLDKAAEEKEHLKRAIFLNEAEALFMEDMPIIPLFFQKNYCLVNKKLKNFQISPLGEVKLTESYFEN
jgi:oligopeptide transport system substrate-binding protein